MLRAIGVMVAVAVVAGVIAYFVPEGLVQNAAELVLGLDAMMLLGAVFFGGAGLLSRTLGGGRSDRA
jgi:hypothetical protein